MRLPFTRPTRPYLSEKRWLTYPRSQCRGSRSRGSENWCAFSSFANLKASAWGSGVYFRPHLGGLLAEGNHLHLSPGAQLQPMDATLTLLWLGSRVPGSRGGSFYTARCAACCRCWDVGMLFPPWKHPPLPGSGGHRNAGLAILGSKGPKHSERQFLADYLPQGTSQPRRLKHTPRSSVKEASLPVLDVQPEGQVSGLAHS